jgi:hypothetical protein
MKEIKLSYVTIVYKEPIIYRRYTKSVIMGPEEILECTEATNNLTNLKPYLALVDTRIQINLTPEGHKISIELQQKIKTVAQAVLVNGVGERLVVKAFTAVSKPPYPMEVFTDEDKAVEWLMKQWEARKY